MPVSCLGRIPESSDSSRCRAQSSPASREALTNTTIDVFQQAPPLERSKTGGRQGRVLTAIVQQSRHPKSNIEVVGPVLYKG